jgi:hypothetical protein
VSSKATWIRIGRMAATIAAGYDRGMPNGALIIADFPGPVVEVHCSRCDRRGRYARARLAERFGPDMRLPASRASGSRSGAMTGNTGDVDAVEDWHQGAFYAVEDRLREPGFPPHGLLL